MSITQFFYLKAMSDEMRGDDISLFNKFFMIINLILRSFMFNLYTKI